MQKNFIKIREKNVGRKSSKNILCYEALPQAPDAFGLNSPSQLVIGYHWLALTKSENKNSKNRFFLSLRTLCIFYPNLATLERGGVCMSLIGTGPKQVAT